MCIVALIGEVIVPLSERQAQTIRATALQQTIALGDQHGFWVRDGMRYLYVGRVYPDLHLGNIDIYEFDENKHIQRMTRAQSASYINSLWVLRDVERTELTASGIITQSRAQETWPELLNPDLFNIVSVKPANMSALDLYRYSDYLRINQLDSSHYLLAFWIKVMTPISTLVMLLIALPFVFGSQRSGGAGNRLMLGLLLGIGFFLLNRTMNHFGQVSGLDPLFSAAFPVALMAMAGLFAIRRVH